MRPFLFAAAKTIYKYRAGDDDLGQLQDLKSDITEFSNSPTTMRSPGKSKSPKEGGRGDMRKRKGSQAERRQIPTPRALSANCQSTSDEIIQ